MALPYAPMCANYVPVTRADRLDETCAAAATWCGNAKYEAPCCCHSGWPSTVGDFAALLADRSEALPPEVTLRD